jgi:hypothetical protein
MIFARGQISVVAQEQYMDFFRQATLGAPA